MNINYLFIIILAIVVGIVLLYNGLRKVLDAKIREEEEPKFEPRKVTDLSKGKIGADPVKEEPVVAPKKKKYYKKRPTKKSE